jgi:ribonuclease D
MCREVKWVSESKRLLSLLEGVGAGPLAVDTEADSMHHYPEKVCLVQLSFADSDLLLDPLAELDPYVSLQPLFGDPAIPKIMHGADYDLRMLHRDFGLEVNGLFDTMLAARLIGERAFGLAALLKKHIGVELDKRYQRADWSVRPLPEEMRSYAAMDTRYLAQLAGLLESELDRLGRSAWAEEEFHRLERVRWRDSADDEAYRRIKGSGSLSRRGLAILRELVVLREEAALRADRPPFKILSNELLLNIAKVMPRSERELTRNERLPASWSSGARLRRLMDAVKRALDLPEERLPEMKRPQGKRATKSFEKRLRRLCKRRDAMAAELDIEPSLLASRSVLGHALAGFENGESLEQVKELRAWQAGLLQPLFDGMGA